MHGRRLPDRPARYFSVLEPRPRRDPRAGPARRGRTPVPEVPLRPSGRAPNFAARRSTSAGTAGGGASLYSLSFIVLIAAVGAGGLYVYADYRFDQIKKVHAKHLAAAAPPGKPFNLLLVGSDTRAFVSNATQVKAFGNEGDAGGQRSDVTMVARFDPAAKTVTVLSIPRDLWVDIPGNVQRDLGHEPHQCRVQLGPRPSDPDDRAGPGHPDQPLHVGGLPGLLRHGQRPGRHHHGLPDRGQGRRTRGST